MSDGRFDNWRTSSFSGGGSNCVEVAFTPDLVGVRDSKNRDSGVLAFGAEQWHQFIAAVREGEFDLD